MHVLTFAEVVHYLQIMFSMSQGKRPDVGEETLPLDIPYRELMVSLMESAWAPNPEERPSFSSEFLCMIGNSAALATLCCCIFVAPAEVLLLLPCQLY